jgi:hypothetical protein
MSNSVEYEQVTRAIFQALVDQDQARNISVEHDVELTGKGFAEAVGTHID